MSAGRKFISHGFCKSGRTKREEAETEEEEKEFLRVGETLLRDNQVSHCYSGCIVY